MIGKMGRRKMVLPEGISKSIEYHHQPGWTPSFRSEVKLIYLANVLAISRDLPELLSDRIHFIFCSDHFLTEDE